MAKREALRRLSSYARAKRGVDDLLDAGRPLNAVRRRLDAQRDLNDDQRTALWLYAWHFRAQDRQAPSTR